MSTGPNSAAVARTKDWQAASVPSAADRVMALPPVAVIAAQTSSASAARRLYCTATRAPFAASLTQIARPMPRDPPVTKATRPVRSQKLLVGIIIGKEMAGGGAPRPRGSRDAEAVHLQAREGCHQ